jgi:valyl-tRNA synthetase
MTNQERITQLNAYKLKEKFLVEDFEDYEDVPPPTEAVIRMRKEVDRFTDFLIKRLDKNVENLQEQTQQFFKDWDNEEFTQEETEFIVEVEYEAMRIAGVKADDLLI